MVGFISSCGEGSEDGKGEGQDSTEAVVKPVPPQGFWVTSELKSTTTGNVLQGANLMWDFKMDGTFEKIFDFSIVEEGKYSMDDNKVIMESAHGYRYEYEMTTEGDMMMLNPLVDGDTTHITLQNLGERGPEYAPENLERIPMQNM